MESLYLRTAGAALQHVSELRAEVSACHEKVNSLEGGLEHACSMLRHVLAHFDIDVPQPVEATRPGHVARPESLEDTCAIKSRPLRALFVASCSQGSLCLSLGQVRSMLISSEPDGLTTTDFREALLTELTAQTIHGFVSWADDNDARRGTAVYDLIAAELDAGVGVPFGGYTVFFAPQFSSCTWALVEAALNFCHQESVSPAIGVLLALLRGVLLETQAGALKDVDLIALLGKAPSCLDASVTRMARRPAISVNKHALASRRGEFENASLFPKFSTGSARADSCTAPALGSDNIVQDNVVQLVTEHLNAIKGLCGSRHSEFNSGDLPRLLCALRCEPLTGVSGMQLPEHLRKASGGALLHAMQRQGRPGLAEMDDVNADVDVDAEGDSAGEDGESGEIDGEDDGEEPGPIVDATQHHVAFIQCFKDDLLGQRMLLMSSLNNLFKMRSGEELPYKQCGYEKLRDFLMDIPGLWLMGRGNRMQVRLGDGAKLEAFLQTWEEKQRQNNQEKKSINFQMPQPLPPTLLRQLLDLFMHAQDREIPLSNFLNAWKVLYPNKPLSVRTYGFRDLRGLLSQVAFLEKVGGKSDTKYVLRDAESFARSQGFSNGHGQQSQSDALALPQMPRPVSTQQQQQEQHPQQLHSQPPQQHPQQPHAQAPQQHPQQPHAQPPQQHPQPQPHAQPPQQHPQPQPHAQPPQQHPQPQPQQHPQPQPHAQPPQQNPQQPQPQQHLQPLPQYPLPPVQPQPQHPQPQHPLLPVQPQPPQSGPQHLPRPQQQQLPRPFDPSGPGQQQAVQPQWRQQHGPQVAQPQLQLMPQQQQAWNFGPSQRDAQGQTPQATSPAAWWGEESKTWPQQQPASGCNEASVAPCSQPQSPCDSSGVLSFRRGNFWPPTPFGSCSGIPADAPSSNEPCSPHTMEQLFEDADPGFAASQFAASRNFASIDELEKQVAAVGHGSQPCFEQVEQRLEKIPAPGLEKREQAAPFDMRNVQYVPGFEPVTRRPSFLKRESRPPGTPYHSDPLSTTEQQRMPPPLTGLDMAPFDPPCRADSQRPPPNLEQQRPPPNLEPQHQQRPSPSSLKMSFEDLEMELGLSQNIREVPGRSSSSQAPQPSGMCFDRLEEAVENDFSLEAMNHNPVRRKLPRNKKPAGYWVSSPAAVSTDDRDASTHLGKYDISNALQMQLREDVPCLVCSVSCGSVVITSVMCEELFEADCSSRRSQLAQCDLLSLFHQDDREAFSSYWTYCIVSERTHMDARDFRMVTLKQNTIRVWCDGSQILVGKWWQLNFYLIPEDDGPSIEA